MKTLKDILETVACQHYTAITINDKVIDKAVEEILELVRRGLGVNNEDC